MIDTDKDLNEVELKRKVRRRETNRKAAANCREKRIKVVDGLRADIANLKKRQEELQAILGGLDEELEGLASR